MLKTHETRNSCFKYGCFKYESAKALQLQRLRMLTPKKEVSILQ